MTTKDQYVALPETASRQAAAAGLPEAADKPPFKIGVLWAVIGVSTLLLLVILLGRFGVLSMAAVKAGGGMLCSLCAVLMLIMVVQAALQAARK